MKNSVTGSSAFSALAAAAFISGANLRLFDALLPKVADDFAVLPTSASAVITAFTLAYGLFQIVYGPVGDHFGKLRVVAAATLISSAGSLASAFAPTLGVLTVFRFATGVGAAAIVPLSLAWIGDTTSYAERQATLGRFIGFMLMGQVLGPAFGGLLAQVLSWREVFYVMTAVFAAAGVLLLREAAKPGGARTENSAGANGAGALRSYREVLRDPWVRTIVLTVFLEGAFFFGAFAYAGAYLKKTFSLSYAATGAILACYGVGAFLYTLFVRRLLAVMKEEGFIRTGGLVLLVSFALLAAIPAWQAAAPIIVAAGFGFYMFHNTLQTKATEMAPRTRGTGIAVFAFCLFMGQTTGVAASGLLIRSAGYAPAFAAAGVLLFLLSRLFAGRLAKKRLRVTS